MRAKLEILDVSLLDTYKKDYIKEIDWLCYVHGTEPGWHYILDLAWILNKVSKLPKGSTVVDVGAGGGSYNFC